MGSPLTVHYHIIMILIIELFSATSVDVEHVFSSSQLLLSYTWNWLSVQTTHSLMCLGEWSLLNFVHNDDLLNVTGLLEVPDKAGDEDGEVEMPIDWDKIN